MQYVSTNGNHGFLPVKMVVFLVDFQPIPTADCAPQRKHRPAELHFVPLDGASSAKARATLEGLNGSSMASIGRKAMESHGKPWKANEPII